MGADFICAYVPVARLEENRKRRLLDIVAAEVPFAWDEGYDNPEDCRDAVAAAVEYLAGLPNRQTAVVNFPGADYPVLLTGGMSYGDVPTDAFEQLEVLILHAPVVIEQLVHWAKEDRQAEESKERTDDSE